MYSIEDVKCEDSVERLLVLRKRLQMKQYEFAREIGVSPSYLLAIERYRKPFTKKFIKRINRYIEKIEMEGSL